MCWPKKTAWSPNSNNSIVIIVIMGLNKRVSLTLLPSESTLHLQYFTRCTVQRNQVVKKSTSAKNQNHILLQRLCVNIFEGNLRWQYSGNPPALCPVLITSTLLFQGSSRFQNHFTLLACNFVFDNDVARQWCDNFDTPLFFLLMIGEWLL